MVVLNAVTASLSTHPTASFLAPSLRRNVTPLVGRDSFLTLYGSHVLQMGLMAHATAVVELRVSHTRLCKNELRRVGIAEMAQYERVAMEGVNYELRCHHPNISEVVQGLAIFCKLSLTRTRSTSVGSPGSNPYGHLGFVANRAEQIMHRALVFSDATFLFSPRVFATASVVIALRQIDGHQQNGPPPIYLPSLLRLYILDQGEQAGVSEKDVEAAVFHLYNCPEMDLLQNQNERKLVATRARELKQLLNRIFLVRLGISRAKERRYKRCHEGIHAEFSPPYKKVCKISVHDQTKMSTHVCLSYSTHPDRTAEVTPIRPHRRSSAAAFVAATVPS